jgi:hypothetical protein
MKRLAAPVLSLAAALVLWHWAQLVLVLCALAWMLASVGSAE